jgi:nicotinate phosphoribosyltransferase
MVTGGDDSAFTGVYKLTAFEDTASGGMQSTMKFSDNPEKTTNPGVKQVWRIKDEAGLLVADVLALEDEPLENGGEYTFWHPQADYRRFRHRIEGSVEPLLKKRCENGHALAPQPDLFESSQKRRKDLSSLDPSYKRLLNPHIYKVAITEKLRALKVGLIKSHLGDL